MFLTDTYPGVLICMICNTILDNFLFLFQRKENIYAVKMPKAASNLEKTDIFLVHTSYTHTRGS